MFNMQGMRILNENNMMSDNINSYYKDLLGLDELYNKGIKGNNLVCAVLDTGCDISHPAFKDKIIGGYNFTSEGDPDDFNDLNGHGTHVAGLISSEPFGNFKGGVAPGAKLLICKVLNKNGGGGFDSIVNAINYAISKNVNVINMSLGGSRNLPKLYEAIKAAYDKGIVVCCASGNEAKNDKGIIDEYSYPGAYQEVIEVGSINKLRVPSHFSNSNNMIDCVCYGENVLSTFKEGQYAILDGTSQATPLVSGCVLLLKEWFIREFGREPSKDEVYATLIKCSKTIKGYNKKQTGFGYIDLKELND